MTNKTQKFHSDNVNVWLFQKRRKLCHVSLILGSYRSVPSFVSDMPSIPMRLLVIQRDCSIVYQLKRSSSETDTFRSVPVQKIYIYICIYLVFFYLVDVN